jgi:hypothetical protein
MRRMVQERLNPSGKKIEGDRLVAPTPLFVREIISVAALGAFFHIPHRNSTYVGKPYGALTKLTRISVREASVRESSPGCSIDHVACVLST